MFGGCTYVVNLIVYGSYFDIIYYVFLDWMRRFVPYLPAGWGVYRKSNNPEPLLDTYETILLPTDDFGEASIPWSFF